MRFRHALVPWPSFHEPCVALLRRGKAAQAELRPPGLDRAGGREKALKKRDFIINKEFVKKSNCNRRAGIG
jgi:hypothetical protein